MRTFKKIQFFILLILIFLVAGCGSSGPGSSNSAATDQQQSQGQVVDPYIVGAVFQELGQNGVVIQRQSSPSNEHGQFTFPKSLSSGSIVEMKIGSQGVHAGAPYQGLLSGKVENGDLVLITPLTTLIANGMDPMVLLSLLNEAGFKGLSLAQLKSDPMIGLDGITGPDSQNHLNLLQAAMTVNALMDLRSNYRLSPEEASRPENRLLLHDLAELTKELLGPSLINDLNADLLSETGQQLALADLIQAAAVTQNSLVHELHDAMSAPQSAIPPGWLDTALQQGKTEVAQTARSLHLTRNGMAAEDGSPAQDSGIDGQNVYFPNCATCHRMGDMDTAGFAPDLAGKGGKVAGKIGSGHQGLELSDGDLLALAAFLDGTTSPPAGEDTSNSTPPDGEALYDGECAGCHGPLAATTKPGRTAEQIQAAIDANFGGMEFLNLTTEEIRAIAEVLPPKPAPADPVPTGDAPPDGPALYSSECSGCHGPLASTTKSGRTASQIQSAIAANFGGMGFLTLNAAEIEAIAGALLQDSQPPTDGGTGSTSPDGGALYAGNCAGCHGPLASTTKPGRTATQIQNAINANYGGMGAIALTTAEIQAIADVLPAAPPPPSGGTGGTGTPSPNGETLYANNCSGCHGPLASTTKPGRTATQIQNAINANYGGMGAIALTTVEIQAIADVLPAAPGPGLGGSGDPPPACGSCHSLPPNGSAFPNTAGAHHAHALLPEIGDGCNLCHLENDHQSGWVDLGFPSSVNAKSGTAVDLNNGTCGTIRCHGGKTTPEWLAGTINVATQCSSCHSYGTSQYNSYVSGRHNKHVQDKHYACTVCHSTTKLAANHFTHLTTPDMEGPASGTIGGTGTSVSSYNATTKTCTNSCHGSKNWTGSEGGHDDD